MTRVLAITGGSCVGKSTMIADLNAHLQWDLLSIDAEREHGRDWPALTAKVRHLRRPAIVESIAMPSAYREALKNHDTTIILVTCEEFERQRRQGQRNEARPTGRNYSRSNTHFRIDTTHGLTEAQLQQLADMARTRYARRPKP